VMHSPGGSRKAERCARTSNPARRMPASASGSRGPGTRSNSTSRAWWASSTRWARARTPMTATGWTPTSGGLRRSSATFFQPTATSVELLVPERVERGRIDDPTREVGAISRKPLDHEGVVGDLRMRGDEAERARPLEAEAGIVRGNALDHDGRLARFFGAAERVPDQSCPHTDALAVRPNRHRREIEDPCPESAFNADPAQHDVSNHA